MVRTIITPTDTNVQLHIPLNYVGRAIEITYLALDELEKERAPKMSDFFGTITEENYNILKEQTEKARKEWGRDI